MKKGKFIFVLGLSALLISCSCSPAETSASLSDEEGKSDTGLSLSGEEKEFPDYTVTFHSNGGSEVAPIVVEWGEFITKPADPVKEGYVFDKWCWDEEYLVTEFEFDKIKIFSDTDLYARWVEGSLPVESSSEEEQDSSSGADSSSSEAMQDEAYVDYYLVGESDVFSINWNVKGGLRMYENEGNKAYIPNVSLKAGDMVKVVYSADGQNANDWYGGQYGASDTGWSVSTDGNNNIVINATGTYTIYLNDKNEVWPLLG